MITEDTLSAFCDEVNRDLYEILRSFPADTDEEQQRRVDIIRKVAQKTMLAALLYVKERDRVAFKMLASAAGRHAEGMIRGESPTFEVRPLRKDEQLNQRTWAVIVLSSHRDLTERLRTAFLSCRPPRMRARPRPTSEYERYGDRQREGSRRFYQETARRANAIFQIAKQVHNINSGDGLKLPSFSAVHEWARERRAPADVSKRLLAAMLGKSTATIRNLLVLGAQQEREVRELPNFVGQIYT